MSENQPRNAQAGQRQKEHLKEDRREAGNAISKHNLTKKNEEFVFQLNKQLERQGVAKEKRPDLNIDGPLQYDAAVMPNVAAQKAPGSSVAGKATVFIFPSLEVGNVVYKAVQRSADLVSIGPMLQGMRKPVNDLSRGALVDDIIYTIAITAIQATQE